MSSRAVTLALATAIVGLIYAPSSDTINRWLDEGLKRGDETVTMSAETGLVNESATKGQARTTVGDLSKQPSVESPASGVEALDLAVDPFREYLSSRYPDCVFEPELPPDPEDYLDETGEPTRAYLDALEYYEKYSSEWRYSEDCVEYLALREKCLDESTDCYRALKYPLLPMFDESLRDEYGEIDNEVWEQANTAFQARLDAFKRDFDQCVSDSMRSEQSAEP